MGKKEEVVVPKYDVKIVFDGTSTATIHRGDNYPFIVDLVDNAVKWIAEKYKGKSIEVIGNKPDCWSTFFPAPVVENKEEPAKTEEVAPVAEVAPVVNVAETIAPTTEQVVA